MKILHVTDSIDPALGGGTAARALDVALQSAKRGATSTLVALDPTALATQEATRNGMRTIRFPAFASRYLIPKLNLGALEALVKEHDLCHMIGHWSILNLLVGHYARKHKKPYVFCPAGSLPIWGRSRLVKTAFNLLGGRMFVRKASAAIAVVPHEARDFADYGVPMDKVHVVPNGMDMDGVLPDEAASADFRDRHDIAGDYILFLGRLNAIKGPDLLLEAFARTTVNHATKLVFAGPDNGMLAGLKTRTEELGLGDRVRFIGFVQDTEKALALSQSMFLAISSRKEAMSVVVLEAAKYGRPALATDQCGLEELLDETSGLIVPASEEGLAQGLLRMIQSDLDQMGRSLAQRVRQRYVWDVNCAQYFALYRQLLETGDATRT